MASSGSGHSLFLDIDCCVWSCGNNKEGESGLGDEKRRTKPEKISKLPPIQAISAGSNHSLLLDHLGSVWSFGNNCYGQLGLYKGTNTPEKIQGLPSILSIQCIGDSSFFIDCDGFVRSIGCNNYGQLGSGDSITNINLTVPIPFLPKIISVSGGCLHSLFLDAEGSVWSCGHNGYCQLGLGTQQQEVDHKNSRSPNNCVGSWWWSFFNVY